MKRFLSLSALLLLVLHLSSCLEFRQISLYDGEQARPAPERPKLIDQVVSPVLFTDDTLNVWGIVDDSCKNFELVRDITYQGDAGLKLSWNRAGCEWIGFGMGWDDYAGKNLEPLMDIAAFEMYVRTQKGKAFGLPLVFTLEDYSEVMSFCYTANKYFERTTLDEEWQKVTVPLSAFDDEGEGIDYSNIKQLQIEMQQSGAVYIDEIRLNFYEEVPQEPWMIEETLADPTTLPQTLFEDGFVNGNGWGLLSDNCQTIQLSEEETFKGSKSLHAKWNASDDCKLVSFGVNWHKWRPIDISGMKAEAVLQYYLKAEDLSKLDFQMILKEFDGPGLIAVDWNPSYASQVANGWYKVEIPMNDFQGEVTESKIQHLIFEFAGEGEMFVDQMSWVAQ